jgi:hypothetical protein
MWLTAGPAFPICIGRDAIDKPLHVRDPRAYGQGIGSARSIPAWPAGVVVAIAWLALAAGPAAAADPRTVIGGFPGEFDGLIHAAPQPGQANDISITLIDRFTWSIRDRTAGVRTVPSDGTRDCRLVNATEARCPVYGFAGVQVDGSDLDDTITVSSIVRYRTFLNGGDGDDTITGGSGPDSAFGDDGDDVIALKAGDDFIDESVFFPATASGADVLSGGVGTDTVGYRFRTAGVRVDLDDVADDGEPGEGDNVKSSVENLIGGAGPDRLRGSTAPNLLVGLGGNDILEGLSNRDTYFGDESDPGDEVVPGDDTLLARHGDRDASLTCGEGPGDADVVVADAIDPVAADPSDCETVQLP